MPSPGVTLTNTQAATYAQLTLSIATSSSTLLANSSTAPDPDGGTWTVGDSTVSYSSAAFPTGWAPNNSYSAAALQTITYTADALGSGQSLSYDLTALTHTWELSSTTTNFNDGNSGSQANVAYWLFQYGPSTTTPDPGCPFSIWGTPFTTDGTLQSGSTLYSGVIGSGQSFSYDLSSVTMNGGTQAWDGSIYAPAFTDGTDASYPQFFITPVADTGVWSSSTIAPDGGTITFGGQGSNFNNTSFEPTINGWTFTWTANQDFPSAVTSSSQMIITASYAVGIGATPSFSAALTVSNSSNQLWSANPSFQGGVDAIYTITVVGNAGQWQLSNPENASPVNINWNATADNGGGAPTDLYSAMVNQGYYPANCFLETPNTPFNYSKTYAFTMQPGAGDGQNIQISNGTLSNNQALSFFLMV